MTQPTLPRWLPAAILVTALLSLYSISYRYRVEQHNRAVSVAVEYETVEAYAAADGTTVDKALAKLKLQGLGSVVLSEEYVADLINSHQVDISSDGLSVPPPKEVLSHKEISGSGDLLLLNPVETRISKAISIRFPRNFPYSIPRSIGTERFPALYYGHGISSTTLRATPAGLNPDQAATIKKAGLGIIARMANPPGVSSAYVKQTLEWAHSLGAGVFLPMGDQVLGRRESLKTLTAELERLNMVYASPEFSKLGGDESILQSIPERVVRLHAAQAAELDKLRPDEAVGRYSLAARERGMRILLVRPLSYASDSPMKSLDDFILKIDLDCRSQGLDMGSARPFDDSKVPSWLFLLIGLSIVPTAYFVGATFVKNRIAQIVGFVFVLAIGALAITRHGKPFTALLAAIIFPIAAFIILDTRKKINPIVDFLLVSLISLVGGLVVAGLLNGLPYFIRAEQFEGVKLAVFLPVFVVALYFLMRGTDIKAALRNPMTWGTAILAIVILGALLFMSSRTGNDNPAGVSDLELKMRFLLDKVLLVRPRTKEFMVGHPLLYIGIALLAIQRRTGSQRLAIWSAFALAGGAIGQTDIVNTMCHIHTPVMLSLMRIGVGMVAGCIIGLAVWSVAQRWLPAGER